MIVACYHWGVFLTIIVNFTYYLSFVVGASFFAETGQIVALPLVYLPLAIFYAINNLRFRLTALSTCIAIQLLHLFDIPAMLLAHTKGWRPKPVLTCYEGGCSGLSQPWSHSPMQIAELAAITGIAAVLAVLTVALASYALFWALNQKNTDLPPRWQSIGMTLASLAGNIWCVSQYVDSITGWRGEIEPRFAIQDMVIVLLSIIVWRYVLGRHAIIRSISLPTLLIGIAAILTFGYCLIGLVHWKHQLRSEIIAWMIIFLTLGIAFVVQGALMLAGLVVSSTVAASIICLGRIPMYFEHSMRWISARLPFSRGGDHGAKAK